MTVTKVKFIFIGAPGVGKGTFAKILCSQKGWNHFSVG
jgi:adenylate kinase family enzyme